MADRRSQTSAENGKKGGRPVSEATIRAQLARKYIAEQVQMSLGAITAKAITQAVEGDDKARDWLSHYAWGKPAQSVNLTSDPIDELDDESLEKARQAIGAVLDSGDTE